MTPYHADPWLTIYLGDCREVMAQLEPESVHCVVTSPPYWGLRDYGTATWVGGDEACDHVAPPSGGRGSSNLTADQRQERYLAKMDRTVQYGHTCRKCGAVRQDAQLGREPTPEQYVENMVAVFREVRRVLRSDGTVWLNLGDSYNAGTNSARNNHQVVNPNSPGGVNYFANRSSGTIRVDVPGLKPKDLVGIPWRVAFALQADGWYLRSDIIWSKPNPMPESVTDRPTKSHEYLFLLSKSPRYYFDADAVREANEGKFNDFPSHARVGSGTGRPRYDPNGDAAAPSGHVGINPSGRNIRTVWTIATQPYPGAHFATFPRKLVEPCIKAGTSEKGVCPECGAPWERVVERIEVEKDKQSGRPWLSQTEGNVLGRDKTPHDGLGRKTRKVPYVPPSELDRYGTGDAGVHRKVGGQYQKWLDANPPATTGWRVSCRCEHDGGGWVPVPATVLDPFAGSGTTALVAQSLSRRAVLIDLNGDYLEQVMDRNRDIPLGLGA